MLYFYYFWIVRFFISYELSSVSDMAHSDYSWAKTLWNVVKHVLRLWLCRVSCVIFRSFSLTNPDKWSAAAMYQATRMFASNLNAKLCQRLILEFSTLFALFFDGNIRLQEISIQDFRWRKFLLASFPRGTHVFNDRKTNFAFWEGALLVTTPISDLLILFWPVPTFDCYLLLIWASSYCKVWILRSNRSSHHLQASCWNVSVPFSLSLFFDTSL